MEKKHREKLTTHKYRDIYDNYNRTKEKQKIGIKIPLLAGYGIVWLLSIISFWVMDVTCGGGYALFVFYFILPMATIINTFFIGKDVKNWSIKWFFVIVFGMLYLLAGYLTFDLANGIYVKKIPMPNFSQASPGIFFSVIGIILGTFVRRIQKK